MTYDAWLTVVTYILMFAGVVSTGLVFLYMGLPWKKTAYGRALMFNSVALAIAIDARLALTFLDATEKQTLIVEGVVYSILALAVLSKTLVVLNEYRNDYNILRKDRHASQQ